jgi:acyl-CoA thioester hydrolase
MVRHRGDLRAVSKFSWPVRVYYEDTDSGGVVYYANYLRFMERARTERLRHMGVEQQILRRESGILFAVRAAELQFLRPACLDDALLVSAELVECRRASLVFEQAVYHAGDEARIFCTARVRVACLQASTLRPHAIPDFIRQELTLGN